MARSNSNRAWCLIAVWAAAGGCGDDTVAGSRPDRPEVTDAGTVLDGGFQGSGVAPPVFTPCPDGWEAYWSERLEIFLCEPWPNSSPIDWPCPGGWRRVSQDGVETCDPYASQGPAECGRQQVHYPGETGCITVGSECPAGDFAAGLPAGASIIYVKPGAQGGDGRGPASPLASIDSINLGTLAPDTVVALSKGTHRWTGTLSRSITLWGACPGETILSSPSPVPPNAPPAIVNVETLGVGVNRQVVIKNLTISDSSQWGAVVRGNPRLRVEGVIVDGTTNVGLTAVQGGRLTGSDIIVRNVRPSPNGTAGQGLYISGGASAELSRTVFSGNREVAVLARGQGTKLILEDTAIRDTRRQAASGAFGQGLQVNQGAEAEVRRVWLARNREVGVTASGTGTKLVLQDAIVRETRSQASDQTRGRGLTVQIGASAEVRRATFTANQEFGIGILDNNTRLTLEDVLISSTESMASDGTFGRGLNVVLGAWAEVRRAVFVSNRGTGVFVSLENSQATLEDVVIGDTEGQAVDGAFGRGLNVQSGARVFVRRALLSRNRESGVYVDGAAAELEDIVVRDTRSRESDDTVGRGLMVQRGATVTARRLEAARNQEIGVAVLGAQANLLLEDAAVYETQSQASDRALGRGLNVDGGGAAQVRRVIFDRNQDVSVLASGDESLLVLQDARIRETGSDRSDETGGRGLTIQERAAAEVDRTLLEGHQEYGIAIRNATGSFSDTKVDQVQFPPCADASPACDTAAIGVSAFGTETVVVLERVEASRAQQCGLYLAGGAQADGTDVVLSANGIGLCIDDPLYDLNRIDAELENNLQRLIFENLPPPPEPLDAAGD